MKRNYEFALRALKSMVALGVVAAAVRAGAETIPQVVHVVKVEGNAQYSVDGRTWQMLHVGDVLKPGAVIRTAERSLVDVTLGDEGSSANPYEGPNLLRAPGGGGAGAGGGGATDTEKANIVRIFQSTVLGVDKLTLDRTGVDEVSDTQLDLRAGQIMGNVKKLSAQSRYEIKVPNGVAGIRGSWYIWSSAGKGVNGDGHLKFAGTGPDLQVHVWDIPVGFELDAATGQMNKVSDTDFDAYKNLYQDMLGSASGEELGALISFLNNEVGNTCNFATH